MRMHKETTLSREVEAREIPSGVQVVLRAGDNVVITQSLGGSYTVITPVGFMARIEGKDADAIGEEVAQKDDAAEASKTPEERVWEELKSCYDPEIPVNIVDLGLVYKCEVTPRPEGGLRAEIRFTLTAPGCGMGDVLKEDIKTRVLAIPGIEEADIQVLFDPPWSMAMMSDAAKLQLGML
jgi:probable FeS assembly SUF system protein SufT